MPDLPDIILRKMKVAIKDSTIYFSGLFPALYRYNRNCFIAWRSNFKNDTLEYLNFAVIES